MNLLNKISLLILTFLLSACFGSPSSVPEDRFYTIKFADADIVAHKYKRINIGKVRAYGIYNERAMLYSNAALPLQIKRYHYHHWVMPPTQLIQHGLKEYLTQSRIADEVMVHEISKIGALRISVELLAFERVIRDGQQSVHVELAFNIHKPNGQYRSYHYEENIKTQRDTLHSAAEAYGVALSRVFKNFINKI